ncbi:MAG: purine-nucleoside phosphorylase [Candidatus Eisenbacteria sp.]|nr:purine-nucleoside phosphorylase [Candidatus Eisenbacteria bacterium]
MDKLIRDIPEAALGQLRKACGGVEVVGAVVLGSGLGVLLESWKPEIRLQGEEITGYPHSSVAGHAGQVAVVRWGGRPGLVFQGRVHFYEGYHRSEVTFAVRLAAALGAKWLLLTNAAGAVDPLMIPGTVMVVEDHLRILLGPRASRGASEGRCLRGSPYNQRRVADAFRILSGEGLTVVRGVLGGGLGPTYETAAEVEMIRRMGAHAACMSTVIEAEEAARQGVEVAALSLVTNFCTGLSEGALDHAEVVSMAREAGPRLARGIAKLVESWC